jgi:hypothetical protein
LTHPPLKSSVSDSDVSYANNNGWSPAEEKSPSDTKFPESPDDLSEWVRRHKEVRTARHDSASSQVTSDQEMHWPPPQPPQYNLETVSLPETSSYVPRTFLTEDGAGSHMHHDNVLDEEERLVEEALRRSKQDVIQPLRRTDTGTDPAELELAYKLSLNGWQIWLEIWNVMGSFTYTLLASFHSRIEYRVMSKSSQMIILLKLSRKLMFVDSDRFTVSIFAR